MTSTPPVSWLDPGSASPPRLPHLDRDERADAVVVGGGVAGLSCAQVLIESGRSVVLLERDTCGAGASGRSSGFVTPDSEMELGDLIRVRGPHEARRLWEFALSGVEAIRTDIERHAIACDLQVHDSLFVSGSARGDDVVRAEHGARRRLGYASTLYDDGTVAAVLGAEDSPPAVRYPGTFGIDAFKYCQGMREVLREAGATVHEGSPVHTIAEGRVESNGHAVRAEAIFLCLDRFLPEVGVVPEEIFHAQTFLALSAPLAEEDVAAIFPESPLLVWDTDLVYRYYRVTGDRRLLVGGGSLATTYERHERESAPRILRNLRAWLRHTFPRVPVEIEAFWPGLIGVSKDFLPVAGLDPARPTIRFVGGAAGLPWAAALGRYAAEKLVADRSDLDAEFDQHRHFAVGRGVQRVIGKPAAFALSHGIVKAVR